VEERLSYCYHAATQRTEYPLLSPALTGSHCFDTRTVLKTTVCERMEHWVYVCFKVCGSGLFVCVAQPVFVGLCVTEHVFGGYWLVLK
jgi:hypothetical protein